ncbi:MAG: hypothetical protein KF856_02195 [Cyclobacteriaceae bacterium]|nr:hypothetical protein [Cyclobacteriaceae bacterium]
MARVILVILVSIQFNYSLVGQDQLSTNYLANTVVGIIDQFGSEIKFKGTGVIISDSSNFYLVSAAHVTDSIKGDCFLIFKKEADDKPISIPLKSFFGNRFKKWTNHLEADLSYIQLIPFDKDTKARLLKYNVPLRNVYQTKKAVEREINVITMGFPVIHNIGQYFSPLSFNSFFSSGLITLPRADTKKQATFQLLENPSAQGYSGGPVFVGFSRPGATYGPDRTFLVGIVHGTFSDNTGGKLAMITPGFYIVELIKN